MFSTKKFGGYLSRIRKNADMTQSELADKLNLTRQAISRYEQGDSFPDIAILISIAEIFDMTIDELINSGDPSRGEARIFNDIALGSTEMIADNINDFINLAPWLKPSVLAKIAKGFEKQGIDITAVVSLAEYLNDESINDLLKSVSFGSISEELLERFIPLLNEKSKEAIFEKILDGEIDWHFIQVFLPYAENMISQIEAGVMEGALPKEVLAILNQYFLERNEKN